MNGSNKNVFCNNCKKIGLLVFSFSTFNICAMEDLSNTVNSKSKNKSKEYEQKVSIKSVCISSDILTKKLNLDSNKKKVIDFDMERSKQVELLNNEELVSKDFIEAKGINNIILKKITEQEFNSLKKGSAIMTTKVKNFDKNNETIDYKDYPYLLSLIRKNDSFYILLCIDANSYLSTYVDSDEIIDGSNKDKEFKKDDGNLNVINDGLVVEDNFDSENNENNENNEDNFDSENNENNEDNFDSENNENNEDNFDSEVVEDDENDENDENDEDDEDDENDEGHKLLSIGLFTDVIFDELVILENGKISDISSMFLHKEIYDPKNNEIILNVENLNTSSVTKMVRVFKNCCYLKSLKISSWDTSNVYDMYGIFDCCQGLETLDMFSITPNNVNLNFMFNFCNNLKLKNVSFINHNQRIYKKLLKVCGEIPKFCSEDFYE